MEINNKFEIKDLVTSIINPNFLGQVTSIIIQPDNVILYTVSYFEEGKPLASNMFGLELELVDPLNTIGFKKSS